MGILISILFYASSLRRKRGANAFLGIFAEKSALYRIGENGENVPGH
jgi:hypothetical protein